MPLSKIKKKEREKKIARFIVLSAFVCLDPD
jgi:hypothetical protein